MKPASPFAVLVAIVLIAAGPIFCQSTSPADTLTNLPGCWGVLQTKQLSFTYNAYGRLGLSYYAGLPCGSACDLGGVPCGNFVSPAEGSAEYLFGGGLWVGGIVGTDTIVSVSMGGWFLEEEFSPLVSGDNPKAGIERFESVSDYSLRLHLTDAVQSTGEPNPEPLGVEVIWRTHVWESPTLNKAVLHDLVITNVSGDRIEEGVIGVYSDADVGDPLSGSDANDDISGSLKELGIGYVIDNDGNPGEFGYDAGSARRCFATRFLASSFDLTDHNLNWWISNGNPTLDYGPRLDDSLYRQFEHLGTGTPTVDWQKYYVMAKPEWDFDQVYTAYIDSLDEDWREPPEQTSFTWSSGLDARFLLSIGKFDLEPDSSVRIVFTTFTGAQIHQDPHIEDYLWANQPTAYIEALNFDDLIAVANAAEGAVDSLLSAKAPVSGLAAHLDGEGKTTLTWDPYVFDGLDGYDIYLEMVAPSALPYPGTCPPWLRPGNQSRMASISPASSYAIDKALDPDRFYLVNVGQRRGDTLGSIGQTVNYRPAPRAAAPTTRAQTYFFAQLDTVRIEPGLIPSTVDHFNVYLLPSFGDTADLYHPFYDRGEARDSLNPVDSFLIDGQQWYYYAMQPALQVDGTARVISLGGVADSNAVVITTVNAAGFESEFSLPVRLYAVPERDRDVLVLTRGSISSTQAYPDSITAYYGRLLNGLDHDIYSVGDSTVRPTDWPWWLVMMPYRLTIIDDDLLGRVMFSARSEQMENYVLSGGHLLVCGSLFELSTASFSARSVGWHATDSIASRLLGIDSVFALSLRYYEEYATAPYVDSLGGFVSAVSASDLQEIAAYDPTRDPLRPLIRTFWPIATAPITAAFHVTEGTVVEQLYHSLYPSQSLVHGEPVVVSRPLGLGKVTTAGFHLWYMDPVSIEQWLPELREKTPTGIDPDEPAALPTTYALAQNYPNPFNPSTTIEFSLPEAGEVTLEIFNVLGQRVGMPVAEYLPAGTHTVAWHAAGYSSGVYFYRLSAPDVTLSRKMLLLK